MCKKVDYNNEYVDKNIKTSNDENQCSFRILKDLSERLQKPNPNINLHDIIQHQEHQQKSIERKNITQIMCLLSPLLPIQTPNHTK